MFRDYSFIHRQLAEDRRVKKVYRKFVNGDIVTEFGAVVARGPKDPVARRLAKVSCAGGCAARVRAGRGAVAGGREQRCFLT